MSGTPNLNVLFNDPDIGAAVCQTLEIDGETKLMIHSFLKKPYTVEKLKQAQHISTMIDDAFKTKGVKTLYTWGITDEHEKYNTFLGYFPTGKEITINGETMTPSCYEYSKEL